MRKPGAGRFYYPRCGYGQISSAYEAAAKRLGVEILMPARVHSIDLTRPDAVTIKVEKAGEVSEIRADRLWSTIPINRLAGLIQPELPEQDRNAMGQLEYRSMILIYLVLEQNQFSLFDAHYFPGLDIPITRLSEPKNYSGISEPPGTTVLCAELPCGPQDAHWQASDSELGELAVEALAKAGIPVQSPIRSILVKRLRYAYPIYRQGFESHFSRLDDWISQFERVLSFGRQGLFAHDNTHHALYMAYSAVKCLDPVWEISTTTGGLNTAGFLKPMSLKIEGRETPPFFRLGKNYLVLSAAEFTSKALTAVAFAYMARIFGPEIYGQLEFVNRGFLHIYTDSRQRVRFVRRP